MKNTGYKRKSIEKNIALSTIYQILVLMTPLITTPYISRVLGPAGTGVYSYANSYQMYFTMLAALGTPTYGLREIARNRDDIHLRSRLFWEIELLTICTSMICIVIWILFSYFQKANSCYYYILTLSLITVLLDISWFYAGLEEFKYTVTINSIFRILGVVAQLLFVRSEDDVAIYILILSLSSMLGAGSMWFTLARFVEAPKWKELRVSYHLKATMVYFVPTISTSIYTVLDKTLIGIICKDNSENGYYDAATKIIGILKSLTFTSINSVMGSRISFLFAKNKMEEIIFRIKKSIDYILFMGIGFFFGIMGVAHNFIPVFFGAGYTKSISILISLSPMIFIIGLSNCLDGQYYTPAGLKKICIKFILVGAISNVLLNLLLIPLYKGIGASTASVITELLITILYISNAKGFYSWKDLMYQAYKKIIAGLIMFGSILIISLLKMSILHQLAMQIVCGVLIYIVVLVILRDEFINDIRQLLLKKIKL